MATTRWLPRPLRRTRWQLQISYRHIATAATVGLPSEPESFTPPPPSRSSTVDRKSEVRPNRPISDFLTDTFNRQHDYLRISLTERCNLRCLYCMPEEGIELSPNKDLLTTAEICYLSALFVDQGVNKIRLTGGEPTVRKDIVPLMRQLGELRRKGLKEIALTTNGISLHRKLDDMVAAGLTGVNISLDTLDPHQFVLLTRRQGFDAVMKSINKVQEMNKLGAGVRLKINCVAMRGLNDHQILPFVEMTRDQDIEVRFIEYMPFGGNKWSKRRMLPYAEMLDLIHTKYPSINKLKGAKNDTSKTWQVPGFRGKVGFITSMTHNFCGTCNRLRITSDGNLKVCLHGNTEVSLRDLLRNGHGGDPMDEAAFEALRQIELDRRKHQQNDLTSVGGGWLSKERELLEVIGAAVKRKKAAHAGMGNLENMPNRPMILIDEGSKMIGRSRMPTQRNNIISRHVLPRMTVPFHLLHSTVDVTTGTRFYSSESDSPAQNTESTGNEYNPASAPSQAAPIFGFQSLSGLLQRSRRARIGRPRRQGNDDSGPGSIHAINTTETTNTTQQAQENGTSYRLHDLDSRTETRNDTVAQQNSMPFGASTLPEDPASGSLGEPQPRPETQSTLDGPQKPRPVKWPHGLAWSGTAPKFIPRPTGPVRFMLTSRNRTGVAYRSPKYGRRANPFVSMTNVTPARRRGNRVAKAAPVVQNQPWGLDKESAMSIDTIVERGTETPSPTDSGDSTAKAQPHSKPSPERLKLTHLTPTGEAHMVDVGTKQSTKRIAIASCTVRFFDDNSLRLIAENGNKKGDVLGVARIAGIMAAKRTSDLIPLCHPVPISKVEVIIEPGYMPVHRIDPCVGHVTITTLVECTGPTGVEMEALTAASAAALTVYDMCKAVDQRMIISGLRLVYKCGGRRGLFFSPGWAKKVGQNFFEEHGLETPGTPGAAPHNV